jgi:hypothetical protein
MYEISLVPFGYLHTVLPAITPFLDRSEFWSHGRSSIDDIIKFLYTGQMHLWVVYEGEFEHMHAYLITEIKQYPQAKMFTIQYCAGDPGVLKASGSKVFSTMESAARDSKCAGIEFFGRPGWGQYVKEFGCTVQTVVYEKHFTDEVKEE